MTDYKSLFLRHLDEKGVHYTDGGENHVRVSYSGDNISSIPINVIFDKNGKNYVQLDCWNIAKFNADKMPAGLITCNELNKKFRWVKFYIDEDMDIRCQADMIVEPDTVGAECLEFVQRSVNIIDEAYPEFMKALWA